jgi:ADP-ribose pyrophosphatase
MPASQRIPLYRGCIIDLALEIVDLPGGQQVSLEIARHPGGAVVAAINDKHQICLLRQYRHAADDFMWEVPAGKLDPGEDPLTTARRELEEESGVLANHWIGLGTIYTTPGFCDEVLHLYLAQNLTLTSCAAQPDEYIEVHWLPFTQALEWAYSGQIKDAKTLIILFRSAALLSPKVHKPAGGGLSSI